VFSYEEKLREKDMTIKEQKMIIKDLQSGYKNQLRMQNKDLQLLVEKANNCCSYSYELVRTFFFKNKRIFNS
jgi:hypothetical protein